MSAFQSYSGAYEHGGKRYLWQCYATTRIYQVAPRNAPLPASPADKKWVRKSAHPGEAESHWLVDRTAKEFSQMLLQLRAERLQSGRDHAELYAPA